MARNCEDIVGYQVDTMNIRSCVLDVVACATNPGPTNGRLSCRWLACLNPHSFAVASNDIEFSVALRSANWLVPDGSGIVLASKLLGGRIRDRVTGSDVFNGVLFELDRLGGYSVFF